MTRFLPIVLLAACSPGASPEREPDPTEARAPAAPVTAPERPEFPGVVTSRINKVITSEVDAPVDSLLVSVGKRVRAGDLVARLDATKLETELEKAKAAEKAARGEAARAGAQARAARRVLKQERMLARVGASPLNNVRSAGDELAVAGGGAGAAAGNLEAAATSVRLIKQMLEHTEIKAPIDGVITMIKVREGEAATTGRPIARVFDDRDLLVKFGVPAEHRKAIQKGQTVEIFVEGLEQPLYATVDSISDELEPPVNFTIVEADLDDDRIPTGLVRVASNATVRIAASR